MEELIAIATFYPLYKMKYNILSVRGIPNTLEGCNISWDTTWDYNTSKYPATPDL